MKPQLILIDGCIEHFEKAKKFVDLVNNKTGSFTQSRLSIIQAASDNIRLAASGSTIAMYDGEEMDYFAFYIEERLYQGCFPHATFGNGDQVKVIADTRSGANYVLAVLDEKKSLLWMPLMMGFGVGATLKQSIKLGIYLTVFGYICFFFFSYIDKNPGVGLSLIQAIIPPVGGFIMSVWDFLADNGTGKLSQTIFKKLGFKNSFWLDLRPFSTLNLDNDFKGECIYRCDLAIQK